MHIAINLLLSFCDGIWKRSEREEREKRTRAEKRYEESENQKETKEASYILQQRT